MNFNRLRHGLVLALLLFSCSLFSQDFEVAPVILEYSAEPGGIQTKKLTVRNHGNKKQAYLITLGDQVIEKDGSKRNMPGGSTDASCAPWITLNPSFFELNPNASQEIEVLMQVPNDGFNTRWCMLYVKATKEQTANNVDKAVATGLLVNPRIAVRVIQSPKSNKNYQATVKNFVNKGKDEEGNLQFDVTVVNTGDKVIKPKVYLIVSNVQTAQEKKFPAEKSTMMPSEERTFTLTVPGGLTSGTYSVVSILDYGHDSDLEALQLMLTVP